MSQIPPSSPGFPPPPASSGINFSEWFNIWMKALTKPSAATFEELERHPQVTMMNSFIWVAITGAIGGFLGALIGLVTKNGSFISIITGTIGGAVGGVIGISIFGLIVYAICKAQGGTGTFQTQIALLGTIIPPVLIISLLIQQIPIVGPLISIVLGLYELYLYIVATQAAQNVTLGKAALAVLLPGLLVLCCIIVFAFGLLSLLGIASSQSTLP